MLLPRRASLLLLAVLVPATALADPKDDARRHFLAGLEAASEKNFEVALQRFLAAQDAYPHPHTLYNIARAYQDLKDYDNALTYFKLFRDAAPDKAADVDPVISVLTAQLNQQRGGATPVTRPTGTPVVSGPTAEEIARLQAIAAELEALSQTIQDRASTPVADVGPDEPGPVGPGPGATPELPADGAFLGGAYDRIVVTASRHGQDPLDSPSTISIITDEDIRLSGAANLPDILRRVVGVDVMQVAGWHDELSIRGFNRELNNKVLVLVDGRSVYWDFIGTTFWSAVPISLQDIERVEVIRGPGSAVYGANAVTGVINIITKTPGERPETILTAEYGTPDHRRATGYTSGRVAGTGYRFSLEYAHQGRWAKPVIIEPNGPLVPFLEDQDSAHDSIHGNGRLDRTFLDKGFLSLSGGFMNGYSELYNIGVLGNYVTDIKHTFVRGDVAYEPVHLRVFWNRDRSWVAPWAQPYGSAELGTLAAADNVDVEVEGTGELDTGSVHHKINGGAGYRLKHLSDSFRFVGKNITEHHVNVFLNEEAAIGPARFVLSLRADRHPLLPISQTLSPRGAAIVRIGDNTSVRINGGTAFRAPNLVESYMDFSLSTSAEGVYVRDRGNENIRPERIVTVEAGVHNESTVHTADAAIYYNRITDLIDLEAVTPGINTFDPVAGGYQAGLTGWINTANVFSGFGLEVEAELFPLDGLDLFANVDTQLLYEDDGTQNFRNQSVSLVKVNAGATWRTPYRTDLSLVTHYVSPQSWRIRGLDATGAIAYAQEDVKTRLFINARIGVRPFANQDLELAATAWNALGFIDAFRVREHPVGQRVGPRAYGSITYTF